MPFAENSAWVTGMAWTTCLGSGLSAVWERLLSGASGIAEFPSSFTLRSSLAAAIDDRGLEALPRMRQVQLAAKTAAQALENAKIGADNSHVQPIFGTSYGAHLDDDTIESLSAWAVDATKHIGLATAPITLTTACSAGADALSVGLTLLRQGIADICLCGGVDVLTSGKRLGHSALATLSSQGLFAFDERRSGTVLGEGAAFVVLETARSARARGVRPRGFLCGAGAANDAASATAPDPSGRNVVLTLERTLSSAGFEAADIGLINAHGSGTMLNDDVEARAYNAAFARNSQKPTIFATKGSFGHTLGATGAIEAVATLLALETGRVPPVFGLTTAMPLLELPVTRVVSPCPPGAALSMTLGFGGFNTCLAFQSAQGFDA